MLYILTFCKCGLSGCRSSKFSITSLALVQFFSCVSWSSCEVIVQYFNTFKYLTILDVANLYNL